MISLFDASVFVAKTAIVLLWIVVLYRLLGKRYVGQMNVYDLVTVSAVANSVQNAMTMGKGQLAVGFIVSFVLLFISWLIARALVLAPKLEKVVSGVPTLLAYDGKLMTENMKKQQVSREELREVMHAHGVFNVEDVGMAVIEPDGSISIVPMGRNCKLDTDLA